MTTDNIHQQVELAKKAAEQIKEQNRIFDNILTDAIKGVPKEHKAQVQNVQVFSQRVINLAKEGKTAEAQQLIKEFTNGDQSSK